MVKYLGQMSYSQLMCVQDDTPMFRRGKDVTIEAHGGAEGLSIGLCIPRDNGEMRYFNRAEAKMLAYTLLAMCGDNDD